MASQRSILGLKITSMHLSIALLENKQIKQACVYNLPDHLVNESHVVSYDALGEVLTECITKEKLPKCDVALALSPSESYTRRISMPTMTVEELELNLPYEFRDYISEDPENHYFDYAVLDTKYDDGSDIPSEFDIIAAAVPKNVIADYGSMLHRCGLKLTIATPTVMGFENIIGSSHEDFCFLDIGDRLTMFHMFPKGKLEVSRPIDICVDSFVRAVETHFAVSSSTAASYFLNNYEDAMYIPECMSLYEALATEVGRIISFYNFSFPESSLERVHYSGPGSVVFPLIDMLREQSPIPLVSIADLMPPSQLPQLMLEQCATSIGVALQAFGGQK